jgi:hypothetical protein
MEKIKTFIFKTPEFWEILFTGFFILLFCFVFDENKDNLWTSTTFWRGLHLRGYLFCMIWAIATVFNIGSSRLILIITLILATLLKMAIIRDIAHFFFLNTGFYKILGFDGNKFVNPNVTWLFLLFSFLILITFRLIYDIKKNGIKSSLKTIFPFVGIGAVFVLTCLFHSILINEALIHTEKHLCEVDATDVKLNGWSSTNCSSNNFSCGLIDKNGLLNITNPNGKEDELKQNVFLANDIFNSNYHFKSIQNGFSQTSTCMGLMPDNNKVWIKIDFKEFKYRFEIAELGFHRLCALATWIWCFGLFSHMIWRKKIFENKTKVNT